MDHTDLEDALNAVGGLLQAEGTTASIVVVGGASLSLLGLVPRTTRDVDVIALVEEAGSGVRIDIDLGGQAMLGYLIPPDPLPSQLAHAIQTVARDFGLPTDWMNTDVALQWRSGLPPGLEEEITWHRYEALNVGLVGRRTLISLKLFAAVDDGPGGVHFRDLLALRPTDAELTLASQWVGTQDTSDVFLQMIGEVLALVKEKR